MRMLEHSITLPFKTVNAIYDNYPVRFRQLFFGTSDLDADLGIVLESFWRQVPDDDPRLRKVLEDFLGKPGVNGSKDNLFRMLVPICLHGDAVPCTQRMSLNTYTFNGILGENLSTLEYKMLISCVFSRTIADDTIDQMWQVLSWVFNVMAEGVWPDTDWTGQDWTRDADKARAGSKFAGGFLFVIWQIRGDMEFFVKELKVESYGSNYPCPWCRCTRFKNSAIPWNDWSPFAAWLGAFWTSHAEWLAHHDEICHIFFVAGVCIYTLIPDILHVVDLGYGKHLVGNLLFQLVFCKANVQGANLKDRLRTVWRGIKQRYGPDSGNRVSQLTLSMFCDVEHPHQEFPLLTGRVKGAELRNLLRPLLSVFQEYMDPHHEAEPAMALSLEFLIDFHDVMSCTRPFLTHLEQQKVKDSISNSILCYNLCTDWAKTENLCRFNQVPKFHFFQHIAVMCRFFNPRWGWTYGDESYLQIVKIIGQSSLSALIATNAGNKILRKYRVGMSFVFLSDRVT